MSYRSLIKPLTIIVVATFILVFSMNAVYDKLQEMGKYTLDKTGGDHDNIGGDCNPKMPVVYNELPCTFERLEADQVFVSVDDKIFSYTVASPYSFLGIKQGTDIVLKVPDATGHDIALKLSDEGVLN